MYPHSIGNFEYVKMIQISKFLEFKHSKKLQISSNVMIYIQGCRIRRTPYVYVILYITYAYVYARGGIPPRAYIFGGRAGGLERNRSEQNGTQRNRNGTRHSTGRLGFLHRRSGSTGRFALSALLYRRCGGQKN